MAITVLDVQNAAAHNTSLAASSFAVNPSTGDTIIVACVVWGVSGIITAPTDPASNSYTQIGIEHGVGVTSYVSLWYAHNITGFSGAVTMHTSGSATDLCVVPWLLSGDYVYNADTVGTQSANPGATISSGTSTPAPSGEAFFLGLMSINSGTAATDGSGWNTTGVNGVTAGMVTKARQTVFTFVDAYTEYKVATAAAQAATWTNNAGTVSMGALVASFSAGGVPPNPGTGDETFAVAALSGSGSMPISASGDVTFSVPALSGTGGGAITGSGNVTFGVPALSGTGRMANTGSGGVIFRVPRLSGGGAAVVTLAPTTLTIRRMRRTPHLNESHIRQTFSRLELLAEVGEGLLEGQGSNPQAMLRWSDDGGETWSQEHWAPLGKVGEYRQRVIWRRLGQARDRVFEVVITDPIEIALVTAYLDVQVGAGRR